MNNLFSTVFHALLFFLLTPGILVTLPSNNNKYVVAAVHSIVFVIMWYLFNNINLSFDFGLNFNRGKLDGRLGLGAQRDPRRHRRD